MEIDEDVVVPQIAGARLNRGVVGELEAVVEAGLAGDLPLFGACWMLLLRCHFSIWGL